jgi:protein MPE1
MASSVFYKFKSQRDESRITFNGTGISVFDLKREIILANNLGKANDFDLYLYDAASNQEYTDDSQVIQRSSSIVVKRLPSARPGKGKAAMYIANASTNMPTSEPATRPGSTQNGGPSSQSNYYRGAMSKRFDGKEDTPQPKSSTPVPPPIVSEVTPQDEAAAMAAMFQAQSANWEETQEKMSQLVLPPLRGFHSRSKSINSCCYAYLFPLSMFVVRQQCYSRVFRKSSRYRFFSWR